MRFLLNRSKYLKYIDKNTPLDVIEYILKTTGRLIEKDKILEKIEKIKKYLEDFNETFEIKDSYTEEELQKLITFISDTEEEWNVGTLIKSSKNLIDFHNSPYIEIQGIGSRTNSKPNSFDIIMLYQICQELSIKTNSTDTIDILYQKIKDKYSSRDKLLENIKYKLLNLEKLDLIKINDMIATYPEEENDIVDLSKRINMNYIINKSLLNKQEAIVYATRFFNLDLNESSNPVKILHELSQSKDLLLDEMEIEDEFIRKYQINPYYYRMDKIWKPKLSEIYTSKCFTTLKNYCSVENQEDLENHFKSDTFYEGDMTFNNSDYNNLVSYGSETRFEVLNIKELTEKFKLEKSFGKYLSGIKKLLTISRQAEITDLENIILEIKKYYTVMDDNIKKLKNIYPLDKNYFDVLFEKLHNISKMIMNKEKFDDLDEISFGNLKQELLNHVTKIDNTEIRELVVKLPVLNYKNNMFVKAKENYHTHLVEDLMSLKNMKEKPKEFLNMKTNHYLFTSYYFGYILTGKEPFSLEH